MEETRVSCFNCVYLRQYEADPYKYYDRWGRLTQVEGEIVAYCTKQLRAIQLIRNQCKDFLSVKQAYLNIKGDGMVKLTNIEAEKEKYDLNSLPETIELIAVDESIQQASTGKSGGLKIVFEDREGRQLTQLYTPMSAKVLIEACKTLGITDTTQLQDNLYNYRRTSMRVGFPRMIPFEKVD